MCKESPGPRCSNHARIAMDKALKDLNEAKALHPAASLEVKSAQRTYHETVESYRATPDGLSQLAVKHPELLPKYQKMRDYQVEALAEIRSGRFDRFTTLLSASQSFFDEEEVRAVLTSARKLTEKAGLKQWEENPNHHTLTNEEKKANYLSILNRYEERLREMQKGSLTGPQMEALTALRGQKAPKEATSLETYGQGLQFLAQSREAMRKEIQRIAVLQDVSPRIAGAYHDAYRQEYKDKYSHLPVKEQPNPPKEWVEGEYVGTGFQNDATTALAPSDPATMYATYRLRSDMDAIPDYLKDSRNIATLSVEGNDVNIVLCNNKGKRLENTHVGLNNLQEAAEKLQGRIIVMSNDTDAKNWLVGLSKKANLRSSVLPTYEFSSKHFNLPDNSMGTLCQAMKVERAGTRAELTMDAYLAAKAKINSKWNSKAPRRQASPLSELPINSRWH